jgi:signal peptidase I
MRNRGMGARRRWPLWYWAALALLLPAFAVIGLFVGAVPVLKQYYTPSEGMAPTLLKNDRFLAWMRPPEPLRRGDIILFPVDGSTYIKRIAALPGDRIALRGGIVILNGRPIGQIPVPTNTVTVYDAGTRPPAEDARTQQILKEQFPGEAQPHEILDQGPSFEDDYAEVRVLPGHVFVLGDNRDNSADSRVSKAEMGVEELPVSDISGIAWVYLWGPGHKFRQPVH